jgi:hypothetical protein
MAVFALENVCNLHILSELAQGQWSQIEISWLQIRSRIYCRKYADLGQYRTKLSKNKLTHAFGRY